MCSSRALVPKKEYITGTRISTSIAGPTGLAAPYWVKLARSGSVLTGSVSANGTTWTQVGRVTISMASSVLVGLSANSNSSLLLNKATYTNVTVSNTAPTVAIAAAASPTTVTGATTTLSVTGADDHGESSLMYVGGGSIRGGVYGCSPTPMNGVNQWDPGDGGKNGSMFQANASVGYLRRCFDYRSIMGEIIRDHLGATDAQLNRIIPGYASEATEHLKSGGIIGSTPIIGEIGLV